MGTSLPGLVQAAVTPCSEEGTRPCHQELSLAVTAIHQHLYPTATSQQVESASGQ